MTWVVKLLRSAERDIDEAMAWYRSQEPGLDREFLIEVDASIKRVRRKPSGYARRLREYRTVIVRKFPYTMYYRLVGEEIRIAAVLHHRRGIGAGLFGRPMHYRWPAIHRRREVSHPVEVGARWRCERKNLALNIAYKLY